MKTIKSRTIISFVAIRILDLISTFLCMTRYGFDPSHEAMPLSSLLMDRLNFAGFVITNLFLSYMLLVGIIVFWKQESIRWASYGFIALNAVVVALNLIKFFQ